nr:MobF family relaxase [Cellulomonas sp. P24]
MAGQPIPGLRQRHLRVPDPRGKEVAALNATRGVRSADPVPLDDRARIRTQVAAQMFREEHGREPADARELAATIAKHSRPRTNAVAGYDLTFSPVKSVSTLWAIADRPTAAAIERAHQAAVRDALTFLESTALFTREGTDGVRQVETRGLVAAAFTHRDSRAGDPDLHSHVAVANKVQTREGGRWLAIDGRLMFAATVAASETYNTALERHLTDTLGVRFEVPRGRRPAQASGPARSSASTRRWLPGGRTDEPASKSDEPNWPARSRPPTDARPPPWSPCSWHSRRPSRPGRASTDHAVSPSSAPPGRTKHCRSSAARATRRRCCTKHCTRP